MAERSSELGSGKFTDEFGSDEIYLEKRGENSLLSNDDDGDIRAETPDLEETDDARQIRENIEETRSQMSETIDAIQEKLSIANITEQVKDQVSEQIGTAVETAKGAFYEKANDFARTIGAGLGRISSADFVKKAREEPWILSVIGMSIGAILVGALTDGGKKKKKRKNASYRYEESVGGYNPDEKRFSKRPKRQSKSFVAEDRIHHSVEDNYEGRASAGFAKVGEITDSAYQSVGAAAGKTYESVGQASSFAYEKAGVLGEEMKKNYEHYIQENPLVVGAAAFAVGAAIGYAIPSTKVENQYLGEMRDNVLDKAQASAQDAIGTVKQVVGEAQQIIADEVKTQTAS